MLWINSLLLMEHVHNGLKIRDNWLLFVLLVKGLVLVIVVAAIDVSVVTVAILLPLLLFKTLTTDELL